MSKGNRFYRYLRHLDLPQLGFAGQDRIAAGCVALVGLGGLGAAAAPYLAGAGVGRLILIDDDKIEETNLQRQVIYTMADLGQPKAVCAARHVTALNPQVAVTAHVVRLDAGNADSLLNGADVVLDGSDNFATRYLLNDVCVALKRPLVSASVQGFAGQIGVFHPARGADAPCYRCLFPETPPDGMVPTCPEAGVFGPVVGLMGAWQASEALKELAGLNEKFPPFFITTDLLTLKTTHLQPVRNPHCPTCGKAVN